MLLGRTANGLYWMSRYIERAENMARLVDAGLRMALTRTDSSAEEWKSVVVSAGAEIAYEQKYSEFNVANVSDFLVRDTENPSSVMSSIETARFNARMVRTALTRETWEAINEAWTTLKRMLAAPIDGRDLPKVLDAIKRETALIRGCFYGTMLRNETFDFAQIGTYVERADNTARILDVKYYVLLPSISWVGSTLDNYQWESILRSVSASTAECRVRSPSATASSRSISAFARATTACACRATRRRKTSWPNCAAARSRKFSMPGCTNS
jgi:uncharacterized alpha-E superfamily protein